MPDSIADLISRRFGLPTQAGAGMPATGTVAAMLARRSQRRFKPEPVSDELLEIVFAAALSSPSKSDLQQASIIVVRDAAKREAVNGMLRALPWVPQAPLFLLFCGDNRRMRRVAELRGKPFPNDTLDMFMNSAVDAGIVLQAFITAAESMGLGCCPISIIRNRVEKVSALLELPAGVFPVAGLCVGHPSGAGKLSMRLPPSITVHVDRYDGSRFDAELAAYDERRLAVEPTDPEKQRHADKWGRSDHYTWSEDKARQYSVPERHSFGPYVRGQGFPSPDAGRSAMSVTGTRITVVAGDITVQQVDAIVNAANESLLGGGGVDGAIHRAAGPELLAACRPLGGCPTGEARITPGFRLPAKWVIHTVGPVWGGGGHGEDGLLASCYRECFRLADSHAVRTLAFPQISTGVYAFPMERAARIAVATIVDCLRGRDAITEVRLVCFGRPSFEVVSAALAAAGRVPGGTR